MKKAFSYSLFVALAIAVLCTLTLVACSKDEPVVTGIYLTDASGARIDDSKELGSVPFGTAFADIIDFADYEMHAVYSDGSDVAVGSAYSVMFTTPSMSGYEPIKSFPGIPTVELYNGIAGDTFGKAFVAYDGGAKYLLFNDYDDFAVMCTLNGEWAVPVESVFNGYTRQLEIAADVYGEIAVKIVPDEDYIWTDGTSEPVTLDFEIRKGAFFDFSGEYVSVNLSNDIALPEAEKPEYAKLMGNWFGTSGINGKMASTGMVGYTAAVRFVYTKNDVKEAEYSGTFHNTHGQGAAFYRFDMEFVLASLAGSETRYSGHGDNTGEMHIVDVDSGFLTDKIGEYDNVFFAATAINLTQQISSDKIFYSVNGDGGYTRIKMTGSSVNSDGSGATVVTESEVVMVFDAKGDYVGHKYQSTITTGDNVESFEVEFGICR